MSEVVVLGAGPAGLMAALQAARAGYQCTVFEAAPRVGGMAGSFEVGGQRVDFGSHRLHPATPGPLLGLISELLGNDLQTRPRAGRLRLSDRWVGFPLRFTDLVRTLPPSFTARLAADAIRTSAMSGRGSDPSSFHEAVVSRLGPTVAREFYDPYAAKLYGVRSDELHAELAQRRISASSPSDIARRLISARRPGGRTFLYPRRGYGQIAERLAEAAVDAGVTIRLATPVTAVSTEDDRVNITAAQHSTDGAVALSTMPLTALAAMLSPAPPDPVTLALGRLRTRAMLLVYLVLDQARYTSFDAHYLPGPETMISRLSEPKNYRSGDDRADRTVLCAELPCWAGDEWWNRTDAELGDLVVNDLAQLGLPPVTAVHAEVRRLGSVYPVFDRAGAEARRVVTEWTAMNGRLITLGRQGLGVIDNLHHVLAMGAASIESIGPDGAIDGNSWRRHLDEFSLHTVED